MNAPKKTGLERYGNTFKDGSKRDAAMESLYGLKEEPKQPELKVEQVKGYPGPKKLFLITGVRITAGWRGVFEVSIEDRTVTVARDTPVVQAMQELRDLGLNDLEILGVFCVLAADAPLALAREMGFKV